MSVTITLADCRVSGLFCVEGGKMFFEKYGLDWSDFVRQGISSDILEPLDDAVANKIIKVARERQQKTNCRV